MAQAGTDEDRVDRGRVLDADHEPVAVAVLDHNAFPIAGVAVTYPDSSSVDAALVARTAALLSRRLGGANP